MNKDGKTNIAVSLGSTTDLFTGDRDHLIEYENVNSGDKIEIMYYENINGQIKIGSYEVKICSSSNQEKSGNLIQVLFTILCHPVPDPQQSV